MKKRYLERVSSYLLVSKNCPYLLFLSESQDQLQASSPNKPSAI